MPVKTRSERENATGKWEEQSPGEGDPSPVISMNAKIN
jgi:hypothetical protein